MDHTMTQSLRETANSNPPLELPPIRALVQMRVEQILQKHPEVELDMIDIIATAYMLGLQDGAVPLGALLEMSSS